jgi:hypothetical protein
MPAGLAPQQVALVGGAVGPGLGRVDLGDLAVDVVAAEVMPHAGLGAERECAVGIGVYGGQRDAKDALIAPLGGGDGRADRKRLGAVKAGVELRDVGGALLLSQGGLDLATGGEPAVEVGVGALTGELVHADVAVLPLELLAALLGVAVLALSFALHRAHPFGARWHRDGDGLDLLGGLDLGLDQGSQGGAKPAAAQALHRARQQAKADQEEHQEGQRQHGAPSRRRAG